jgi:hypothetical protein
VLMLVLLVACSISDGSCSSSGSSSDSIDTGCGSCGIDSSTSIDCFVTVVLLIEHAAACKGFALRVRVIYSEGVNRNGAFVSV